MIRLLGEGVFDRAARPELSVRRGGYGQACEVLVDHARRRSAARRGGGRGRVPLDAAVDYFEGQGLDIVAVHEGSFDRLAERDGRQAQVMTLQLSWRDDGRRSGRARQGSR